MDDIVLEDHRRAFWSSHLLACAFISASGVPPIKVRVGRDILDRDLVLERALLVADVRHVDNDFEIGWREIVGMPQLRNPPIFGGSRETTIRPLFCFQQPKDRELDNFRIISLGNPGYVARDERIIDQLFANAAARGTTVDVIVEEEPNRCGILFRKMFVFVADMNIVDGVQFVWQRNRGLEKGLDGEPKHHAAIPPDEPSNQ